MRFRDHADLARQSRTNLLQSVAITSGVGKSHVAQALGHLAIRQGAEVRFFKTSRALAHLAGGHADRTWARRLAELVSPAVLILDDFAMRELTAQRADDLYELISERAHAGRSLITTSNRNPPDWYPLFPNPVVAESLLDRLINTSHQVFMNGPSYRPNKRPAPQSPRPPRRPSSITHGSDRRHCVIAARGN
jgi:DNA replication protein DnaC